MNKYDLVAQQEKLLHDTVTNNLPVNFRIVENKTYVPWIDLKYIDNKTECEFFVESYHQTPKTRIARNILYITFDSVNNYPRMAYTVKFVDLNDLKEKLLSILKSLETTVQSYIKGCASLINNISAEFLSDGINVEFEPG